MCAFVSRPMKIVTFLRKNETPQNGLLIFLGKDTFRNKTMEIVEDFDEKSYNNNGKPWKSSRILRVNPFFSFFFLSSSFFSIVFVFFFIFSFFSFFHFFHFSFFFIFLSFSIIFFHFLSFSFIVFHFLSFSFIFYHVISFLFFFFLFFLSFFFLLFFSFSFSFCRGLKI